MSGFTRYPGSGAGIRLAVHEAALVRNLASQLVELLRHDEPVPRPGGGDPLASLLDMSGPVDAPSDPVLARLLPDAYPDDVEAAAEFRRYTERDLRADKVGDANTVIGSLHAGGLPTGETADLDLESSVVVEVELDAAAARSWLRCLSDLRLALATRLGVEQDDDERWQQLPDDDVRVHMHDIYSWLGYLQETLVQALSTRRH